jgi:hypothetical protein
MTQDAELDLVNSHFKKFYPKQIDPMNFRYESVGESYNDKSVSNIFPEMVCVDGFKMSVQGHWGAYSAPRDDFADKYSRVEIMCAVEPLFDAIRPGEPVDGEVIYPYIPIDVVLAVIEKHGGLAGATP